jgi:transposase InsO family protein
MSKARLVITAVVVEGRTQAEVAATYGVSKGWVSKLVARFHAEGEAAFEPRSRRPKTSPAALDEPVVQLILQLRGRLAGAGLDAGPDTIGWHLEHHHGHRVSRSTISRHLVRAGLVLPEPKKRPRSSYLRFEAAMPNQTWQTDFTHYRLGTGADAEIISWLDDCTRYALHVTAHRAITGAIVTATFREAMTLHGIPASTLTDNGMVYTVRLAGGRGGRNTFENELRRLHVVQKNSRPNRPTTCGKVERFQQTLKKWLRARPVQPATLAELQNLLDAFVAEYNHHRPHRSLPTEPPQQPATTRCPKPRQASPATPTPTTGSGTTASTKPDRSPCATTAACTTSASAEPTPQPASSCSSTTCTSESSTPSPANYSANWSSTHTSTTSPTQPPKDPPPTTPNMTLPDPQLQVRQFPMS